MGRQHLVYQVSFVFEHVGSPPSTDKFLVGDSVEVTRPNQNHSVLGTEDDHWMEGLSAADVMRQFGVGPHVVLTLEGKLLTPAGNVYEGSSSDTSGTSSLDESVTEAHKNSQMSVDERKV